MSSIRWQRVLEDSRVGSSIRSLSQRLTKELTCGRTVIRLGWKSGWLHTALYLKQCASSRRWVFFWYLNKKMRFSALYLKECASCLQRAYGGEKFTHDALPVPVSLNRSGYPTRIPAFHRKIIMMKTSRSDTLVRLYLSFFTLSKVVLLVSKDTFASIIDPPNDMEWISRGWLKSPYQSGLVGICPGSLAYPFTKGPAVPTLELNWIGESGLKNLTRRKSVILIQSLPYEMAGSW